MITIWDFLKDKCGRLVSGIGILLSGIEGFDITAIKDPLEGLLGHQWVLRITVALFLLSFARHQWVANQHPKGVGK